MKRALLAMSLLAVGCQPLGDTPFEVEMLSARGTIDGHSLDQAVYTRARGVGGGDRGFFSIEGPTVSLGISTCSVGEVASNPYVNTGAGGDGGVGGDGGIGDQSLFDSEDCEGRDLYACVSDSCVEFSAFELELQIAEADGWRHVVIDAANARGDDAHVELRYREAR